MTSDSDRDWYSPENATFGDRVAGAREAAGMTQPELARRLGVKLSTLRGWEGDVAEPRANKLQMLAGLLNVSLTWLLNGEGDGVAAPEEAGEISPGVNDILSEIRDVRGQMNRLTSRLGLLEKRLRTALKEEA